MQGDRSPDSKTGQSAGDREADSQAKDSAQDFLEDVTRPSLAGKMVGNQPAIPEGAGDRSLIGEIIENQYRIAGILGKGGMSVVYKAVHIALNKPVAIKTMHAHLISDAAALLRFKQEAQAASQLDHANVINVYGFGTTSGDNPQPYIVMDFIEGESLSDRVKKQGLLPVRTTLQIFRQVASALCHAHAKGVIHRDLKPSNIMILAKDGSVKLVDFGIAKLLPQEGEQAHRLTQTGEIFGSPMYMSPEQCMGQVVDKRSDIYSLGCVLYEALSGRPPHQGNTVFETFNKHAGEIPAPLCVPGADKLLTERLDAVVFRALEKQPDKRYQSMSDFEADLASIENELDSGMRGTGLRHGIARHERSLKRFAMTFPRLAALAIVIAGLAGATALLSFQRYSWFFQSHSFQPPSTRWFYFLEARRKSTLSASDKQAQLDRGLTALKFTRLIAGDSVHWLENWQARAELCAKLDSPKDEIEARKNVLGLEETINGPVSPNYGLAAEQLAECLLLQGDCQESVPLLQQGLSIRARLDTPTPKVNMLLGYAYARSGKGREAIAQLTRAIDMLANSDYRLTGLALAMRADQYLSMDGRAPTLRLQYLSDAERDYAGAQEILTASGKNKNLINEIILCRAFVDMQLGKFGQSAALYGQALPYAEKLYGTQAGQLQQILDSYAFACWASGDLIKAGELHARSAAMGNLCPPAPASETGK
jgi:serine/threonine protein kinase